MHGKANPFVTQILLTSAVLLILTHSCASSYEVHRSMEIRPQCQPVSAPICTPVTYEVISHGRFGRSILGQRLRSRSKTRTKRSARLDSFEWRYNSTTFPNFANDENPEEVSDSLRMLYPLISTACSKYLNLFLCSVYSPVCTDLGVVPPCRELCEQVIGDCERTIRDFGIVLPDSISCSLFPSSRESDGIPDDVEYFVEDTALDGHSAIVIRRNALLTWKGSLAGGGRICIPPSEDDVIGPQIKRLRGNSHQPVIPENVTNTKLTKANHRYGLWCPAEMRAPPGQSGYSFLGMRNCSPPCPNMYLTEQELAAVRYVVLSMASLCVIVTFFTLCTFLLDRKRFRYPERPIVFYALSYFIVSVVFILGYTLKENVACNEQIRDTESHDITQGFTVVKGNHKQSCTIMFMLLYYFTVSGTIWWLILTTTWLLAAGFKWGMEAIEQYSTYYHAIAWGIPAIQTLAVVTFSKIEGDNISGVCFLGLYNSDGLRYFLLTPLCVYFIIGITILCAGFCCLNRVRIKLGDNDDRRKLSKFMLRIGVFSVLYIVPQIILLILYAIEDSNRTLWEASWFLKACDDYRVPCPAENSNVSVSAGGGNQQPHVLLFCAKYIMTLIVALPPLFWVASKKTLQSWQLFFCRQNSNAADRVVTKTTNRYRTNTSSISQNPLLREEPRAKPYNHLHNTFDGTDDVFLSCSYGNDSHGSSIFNTRQFYEEKERHSRQNSILQHVIQDIQSAIPPPPLESERASTGESSMVKQFPERRRSSLKRPTESSKSTLSSMTPLTHRQSSSLSSLTSERRRHRHRKRRHSHRTSSLTRPEFKMNLDSRPKTAHSTGSLLASEVRAPIKNEKPRPPPKPRRTASLPRAQQNPDCKPSTSKFNQTATTSVIVEREDGSTVEL